MDPVQSQSPDLRSPRERRPDIREEAPMYMPLASAQYCGLTTRGPLAAEPIHEPPMHSYDSAHFGCASEAPQVSGSVSTPKVVGVKVSKSRQASKTAVYGNVDGFQSYTQNRNQEAGPSRRTPLRGSQQPEATTSAMSATEVALLNGPVTDEVAAMLVPNDLRNLGYLASRVPDASDWRRESSWNEEDFIFYIPKFLPPLNRSG
ncbi:hypothetical protein NLG97_g2216 [Lecanicillium saksenae]|uniref:Uncharacterized protein n=1 Tax=Lecanicillium saksenae TaxID=468837 RepID=A0ACC1R1R8_9HYPO|nr:hypothetical protein NLG97_g2216 [Lecanicillium saksenae]